MKNKYKNEWTKLTDYEKDLANYMYKEYISFHNYGKILDCNIDTDTFKELKEYYDEDLNKRAFNKIVKLFNKTLSNKSFRYYNTSIQLNDNHTLFSIDREDLNFESYQMIVEDFLNGFEEDTDTKVYTDGRSGRHIVVKDNVENFINFNWLQEIQMNLESEMITYINTKQDQIELV